jgi:hypothetical protein
MNLEDCAGRGLAGCASYHARASSTWERVAGPQHGPTRAGLQMFVGDAQWARGMSHLLGLLLQCAAAAGTEQRWTRFRIR